MDITTESVFVCYKRENEGAEAIQRTGNNDEAVREFAGTIDDVNMLDYVVKDKMGAFYMLSPNEFDRMFMIVS